MQDFPVEGGPPNVWGPIFEGRNEMLLLGKALKFVVNFKKYALKLIKIRKIIEKIREKMQIFRKTFSFRAGHNFLIMEK